MFIVRHLKNTSYKNQSGEKVLRIESTLPISVTDAWKLFTTDEKLNNGLPRWHTQN